MNKKGINKIVNHVFVFTVIVLFTTFLIVLVRNNAAYAFAQDVVQNNLIKGIINVVAIGTICIPIILKLGLKDRIGLNSYKNIWKGFEMLSILVFVGLCYSGIIYISYKHDLVQFQGIGMLFSLVFIMLTVGVMEEFGIRGILLQIYLQKWGKTKKGIVWAAFLSSFVFGLQHVFSVIVQYLCVSEISFEIIMKTIFRVFITTSIGFLFAIVMIYVKNIWIIAIIHAVYNLLLSLHYLYLQPSVAYTVSLDSAFSRLLDENNIITGKAEIIFFGIACIIEAVWAINLCYRMDAKRGWYKVRG